MAMAGGRGVVAMARGVRGGGYGGARVEMVVLEQKYLEHHSFLSSSFFQSKISLLFI